MNVIKLRIRITDTTAPEEIFKRIPKYLGEQSKLKNGFAKKGYDWKHLNAGLHGIGKDNSSPILDYLLLQDSLPAIEDEDDNVLHYFRLYFKITEDKDNYIQKAVTFFENCIYNIFTKQINRPEQKVALTSVEEDRREETNLLVLPCMKSSLDFLFNHAKIDYSEIVTMLKNKDLTWLKLLFSTEYSKEDQHQLFGSKINKQFYIQQDQDGKSILQHLADGGRFTDLQEDFISMLIRLDKMENPNRLGGAGRVIDILKEGLPTSPKLIQLVPIVKRHYPI